MQIKCPRCQVMLRVPEQVADFDTVPIQCGACAHQFTLQLNRPELKVKKPDEAGAVSFDDVVIVSNDDNVTPYQIVLSERDEVAGRRIVERLGQISGYSPLPPSAEERESAYLGVFARAQNDLREQARNLGAHGVVAVAVDTVGSEDAPVLRITGSAVRLAGH